MLADAGRDDRFAIRRFVKLIDDGLRFQMKLAFIVLVSEGMIAFPLLNLTNPRFVFILVQQW